MGSQTDITGRISDRQMRLWNALHSTEYAPVNPKHCRYQFLTISRDDGTMGDDIARELARELGWHLFDKEIVNYIAENNHVREEIVRRLDERTQGLVHETILRLLSMPESTPFGAEEYHHSLLKTLATLASHGSAILVGRGSNYALRQTENGLHIRIIGSLEVRLSRVSRMWHVPIEKARPCLMSIDNDRSNFLKHHFRKNFDDLRDYDIVFNTDNLSVEQVVNSTLGMMQPVLPLVEKRVS